jgi:tetratricopeptide (TPR) repeat protein
MLPGGVTWENPYKYYIDSVELEQQVIKYEKKDQSHVDYSLDTYYVWYLAKSYVDFLEDCKLKKAKPFFGKDHEIEMARRAVFYFKKYLEMSLPVSINENLTSLYTVDQLNKLGSVNEMAYMAIVFIGSMYMNYIDPEEALKFLKKSCELDPRRNEGLMMMAYYYHNTNNQVMVYQCTSLAMKNSFHTKIRDFLMESRLYPDFGYEVLDLHSFSAYKLGFYEEAQLTCKRMIDNIQLVPEYDRERIITNYQFFTKH